MVNIYHKMIMTRFLCGQHQLELKKAAAVPQIAITTPENMITPSSTPHLPSIFTLAAIGPIIEMQNAEKDPKNAIIILNSGMKTDTATELQVTTSRWMMQRYCFIATRPPRHSETPMLLGFLATCSGFDIGVSSPKRISNVALS